MRAMNGKVRLAQVACALLLVGCAASSSKPTTMMTAGEAGASAGGAGGGGAGHAGGGTSGGAAGSSTDGGAGSSTGGAAGSTDGAAGSSTDGAAGSSTMTGACGAMFCDDFEASPTFDPQKWMLTVGVNDGTSLTVETNPAMAAHGSRYAHAHLTTTQQGEASITESKTFPALASSIWGRAYLYITVDPAASHTAVVTASANDKAVLEIGMSLGHWQLTRYDPNKEYPDGTTVSYPRNKWACIEWHFSDGGTNLIELYVDGVSAVTYMADGATTPPFTSLKLGIQNHAANPPGNDVYIDDVVIDSSRRNCLP
jgi:hypothetical protein